MSWYRHKVERDLARWQSPRVGERGRCLGHPHGSGLAQVGVRRGSDLCHARRRAVRLRRHELRGRALDGHVEARPARPAAGDAVGLLRRRRLPVPAPAQRLRPRRRARRHRRLRRIDHADRADVPHGGQPARRGAHLGARRAADRRRCCARNPALAATFVLLVVWTCWSAGSASGRTGASSSPWAATHGGGRLARMAPGPASRRHQLPGVARAARLLRASTITRTGSWRSIGVIVAGVAAAGAKEIDARVPASSALFTYGLIAAFAGLFILQFIDELRSTARSRTAPRSSGSCCSPS